MSSPPFEFFNDATIQELTVALGGLSGYKIHNKQSLLKFDNLRGLERTLVSLCNDKVSPFYLEDSLKSAINSPFFDIAVITIGEKATVENIIAFIIAKKGGCRLYSDAYTVDTICSGARGLGTILMGLYLFSILNHPESVGQVGILELVDSYNNHMGLCSNTKFGFVYNRNLHSIDCFPSYLTLPMILDFEEEPYQDKTTDEKKGIVVDIIKGTDYKLKNPLCYFQDEEKSNIYGKLLRTLTIIDYGYDADNRFEAITPSTQPNLFPKDFTYASVEDKLKSYYKEIYDVLFVNGATLGKKIKIGRNNVEKVIRYIENPDDPSLYIIGLSPQEDPNYAVSERKRLDAFTGKLYSLYYPEEAASHPSSYFGSQTYSGSAYNSSEASPSSEKKGGKRRRKTKKKSRKNKRKSKRRKL
jgi:hypothetical protein